MSSSPARFTASAIAWLALAACAQPAEDTKVELSKAGQAGDIDVAAKSPANTITAGQSVTGRLQASDPRMRDGSHYNLWTYQGARNERVTITLESTDFDPYLILGRDVAGRFEVLVEDDDGGDGLNARITHTLPEDGEYVIVANSYGRGEVGTYSLRVEREDTQASASPAAATGWAARYPGGGDPRGRYALLVGIDDYRGIGSSLRGPVADARLIGRILVERFGFRPEHVVILTDRDATREHIAQAFLRHLGQAGPDGVAVFYYSGHGMQMDSNYALQPPLDPEPNGVDEAIYVWGENGRGSIILDDELGFLADRLNTDRMLFILDACYSGTGTRGAPEGQSKEMKFEDAKPFITMPRSWLTDGYTPAARTTESKGMSELLVQPQRHLLLASSRDSELSWTGSGWPRYGGTISVFTYYLAEALESTDATTTFADMMNRVSEQTDAYTRRRNDARQRPQAEGRQSSARIREFLGARQ